MEIFLISFLLLVLASLCMAVGVIAGRRPIRAGCGRFDAPNGAGASCDICGELCEGDQRVASREQTPFDSGAIAPEKQELS